MELTLSSTIQFITLLSPFILSFVLLLLSVVNQNIKGFVYLAGVLLGSFVWSWFIDKTDIGNSDALAICSVVPNIMHFPSYNSYFIMFTAVYMLIPMFIMSNTNWFLLSFFLILFFTDGYFYTKYKCSKNTWGVPVGGLIGALCAIAWFELFYHSGFKGLLYFDNTTSDKQVCDRPSKQTFRCKVFKKGVLSNTL